MHECNLEWKWEMDGSLRFFCKKKNQRTETRISNEGSLWKSELNEIIDDRFNNDVQKLWIHPTFENDNFYFNYFSKIYFDKIFYCKNFERSIVIKMLKDFTIEGKIYKKLNFWIKK